MRDFQITAVLDDIAASSSPKEKVEILSRFKDNEAFKQFLVRTYNPYITYGVTPPKVESAGKMQLTPESKAWVVLDMLAERKLTGNAARETVLELLLDMTPESGRIFTAILAHDVRAGFTANSINKAIPDLIPVFAMMRAHSFEPKRIKSWPVAAEPKLDGWRVIAFVDEKVVFYTRGGNEITTLESLKPEFGKLRAELIKMGGPGRFVMDGEVMSGAFNETSSVVRRKNEQAEDAVFHAFDLVSAAYFIDGTKTETPVYCKRRPMLERLVTAVGSDRVKLVPRYLVNSLEEIEELYGKVRARGLEGLIVKDLDAPYEKKKSYHWLKIKAEETVDARITGAYEGEGKYEGMLGGVLVDVDGVEVGVGGGISDEQRREFWDAWLRDKLKMENEPELADLPGELELVGRMVEVNYHEKTPDGSLRHPRFVRFRDDKADEVPDAEPELEEAA
ncbi:ATP-dependent DNA ligase [Inquilinus sp. OTU3971]|uniref:ATP-dependent DNA ligase n=1 Tax=Inquilinus sp. OTU3971 TaxID=3043855 RepID=UPI00313E4562